jgi:hypothetical protein
VNEIDPMSPCQDFLLAIEDKLCITHESLWWDGKVLDVLNNDNEPTLLEMTTKKLNVDVPM